MVAERARAAHRERQRRYREAHRPVTPVTTPSPIPCDAPSRAVTVTPPVTQSVTPRHLNITFQDAQVCDYHRGVTPVTVTGKDVPLTSGAVVYRGDRRYAVGQHVLKTNSGGITFRFVISGYDQADEPIFEAGK